MPSMKNMGPACCCCNNIYVGFRTSSADDIRRHDTSGNSPTDNGPPGYAIDHFTWGRSIDFDPVHKRVFVSRGTVPTDQHKVFKYDEVFDNQVTLTTLGSDFPDCLTSDSDNELVYFVSQDSPVTTTTLNVVGHDGTGYAAIGALTNPANATRTPIHYCRANGKLYYCASSSPQQLYRINVDGTGDTLIAANATASSLIRDVTIDNDNERIFWIDNANSLATSRIYTADLDGAGATLIYESLIRIAATRYEVFYGPQWSHKNQRLYFWMQDTEIATQNDTTHGWMSIKADGSNPQLHIARGNGDDWWQFGTETPFDWRIACGFETLGAGSTA